MLRGEEEEEGGGEAARGRLLWRKGAGAGTVPASPWFCIGPASGSGVGTSQEISVSS